MTLADWLEPLPDASEQRALDEWAIGTVGVSGLDLMERAGNGVVSVVTERAPTGRVAVVCGKGNNAGDGFVAARVLRERGVDVDVLTLGDPSELRGDARTNFERLAGAPARPFEPAALAEAAVVVDAILGTGSSGAPREPAAGAIEAINATDRATVVAVDVPSGVDASTGEVAGVAVRADATVTFHAGKPGLWIDPGKSHAGAVRVVDIGIPAGGPGEPSIGLITDRVTDGIPRRGRSSTKFAAGSVLVIGGSPGLTGAPCMASEAAMRAGAGYVTACIPASLSVIFELRLLEVMTVSLPDSQGALDVRGGGADEAIRHAERVDAVVLGPGLGREPASVNFARVVAARVMAPLLLDADGLNAHAGQLESLTRRNAPTVLTPHAGELGRLLGIQSAAVGAARLASARDAASSSGAIVVLKGDDTIVAEPGGQVAVSPGGAPALATAGTGDVLSGVIGAYLGKRMDPFHAACAGVFVHVRAGQLAARQTGAEGVIARDVIAALPWALEEASDARGDAAGARAQ